MALKVGELCLGVLTMSDATGYEIKKLFEEGAFSHFIAASYGSIYPALQNLTKQGLVTCRQQSQQKRPDKKIYSITPAGREAFLHTLGREPAPDSFRSESLFVMMFAHLMPLDQVRRMIDDRLAFFDQSIRLFSADGCPCEEDLLGTADRESSGASYARGLGLAIYTAEAAYLRENRHILEALAIQPHSAAAE